MNANILVHLRLFFVAVFLLTIHSDANSQRYQSPSQMLDVVGKSMRAVAAQKGALLDPQLIQHAVNAVQIFTGNYCYGSNVSLCDSTIGNAAVLRSVSDLYISDILQRRTRMLSFGARLARAAGQDIRQTGWPESIDNRYGIVRIPATQRNAKWLVQSSNGPKSIGRNPKFIILPAGNTTIIRRTDNQSLTINIQAAAARYTTLQVGSSGPANFGTVRPKRKQYCYDRKPANGYGALRNFNWGRGGRFAESKQVRYRNLAPFARQTALDIRVRDETGKCSESCQNAMGAAFARSIALWRAGCDRCSSNALTVVKLNRTIWLESRLADAVRNNTNQSQLRRTSFASAHFPWSYDQVNKDRKFISSLCRLPAGSANWISAAKARLCRSSRIPKKTDSMSPLVVLKTGATSCGPASDFIACGLPNETVEISLADGGFTLSGPNGLIKLGRQSSEYENLDLEIVIAHEVGHWFGVPHSNVPGANVKDIMSPTYGDGPMCVSGQSLIMMNNASDLRWRYRVSGKSGLRRPRRKR